MRVLRALVGCSAWTFTEIGGVGGRAEADGLGDRQLRVRRFGGSGRRSWRCLVPLGRFWVCASAGVDDGFRPLQRAARKPNDRAAETSPGIAQAPTLERMGAMSDQRTSRGSIPMSCESARGADGVSRARRGLRLAVGGDHLGVPADPKTTPATAAVERSPRAAAATPWRNRSVSRLRGRGPARWDSVKLPAQPGVSQRKPPLVPHQQPPHGRRQCRSPRGQTPAGIVGSGCP